MKIPAASLAGTAEFTSHTGRDRCGSERFAGHL